MRFAFAGVSVILCLVGAGIETIISKYITGTTTLGTYFNIYRWIFLCHGLVAIYAVWFFRKSLANKPEKLFLAALLITGSMMILVMPFGHNSWDVETHYKWASNASYYQEAPVTGVNHEFIMHTENVQQKTSLLQNKNAISNMNNVYDFHMGYGPAETTIAHRFSGLCIAVSRMFGASFYETYLIGEYAMLVVYAFVCFFAMRKLNSGKMILAVVALLPTGMFLATNYSYDYWVTCFSLLGMSYFISELQKPNEAMSVKDTLIMTGAFAIASLPKLIYATLLVIPFFMKKNNLPKSEKKKYYGICVGVIVILIVMLAIVALQEVAGPGDVRGGSDVSPVGQIIYILKNPFIYAYDLLKFIISYLAPHNANQYMVHYAYFGVGSFAYVILALMAFVTFTDKEECDRYSATWLMRGVSVLVFGVSIVLIATSLYVAYTPVGHRTINGCQPRYLIPLLFPLLSVIGGSKFINKMDRRWYNGIVIGIMVAINFVNIVLIVLPRLV